jgi:hypothetical protein
MRNLVLAILITSSTPGHIVVADRDQPAAATFGTVKTGKERLSDKASDDQRVDDCKVPLSRRTRPRPTACPQDDWS